MIMVEKIFKSNINVVLNGGGDEVFGYHDHFLYFLYNQKNNKILIMNYTLIKDQKEMRNY